MTYRVLKAGFEVLEVPITFRERHAGDSKMSTAIVVEAAWRVPAIRLSGLRRRP
jgi:dolichol-phosphate mannosyltransferase